MRERIMRLSRGIVDAETPKLFLDPVKVEETLGSDTVYKRELYLASENNLYIKGLAYSSHSRVKILKSAFGGLRNHIVYEVDTSWCENGDLIKGNFTLVTNSGELEVPFLFRVEMIESVRVLSTLKSMDDFVELAKKDMELALRLMEYRDFTEAPLFKDLRIRTIYEGLRGHGNRQNALEEFFLATGVKEPIELTLSTAKKVYDKPKDIVNDKVVLRKNTWGYLYMEVRADGDFIEIPKKVITQADFEENRLDLRFRIHPERMHKGKNLGAIRLLTVHGDTVIRIEAMGEEPDRKRAEGEISKAGVCRYMKLREAYESGLYEKKAVLGKIQNELDAIRGANGGSVILSLLQAETYLDAERPDQAALCLDDAWDTVSALRDRIGTLYCYYQYLQYRLEPDEEKKDAVVRLFRKKLEDVNGRFYLQLLQLKMLPEMYEEEEALAESFKMQYKNGCRSPFLYIETVRLFGKNPELLKTMDAFEIHALYYGVMNGLVGQELAERICALAPGAKFFHRLYYRLLAKLCEKYPTKDMLTAVCCLLIKGNVRGKESFSWYEKGINEEISLTRIYEYFLYALPDDYEKMMPRQVLLYFSYECAHLDQKSRAALYANVAAYIPQDDPLYKKYEREMEKFAMEQLFESRINRRLAVIYKHIIYRDMIDNQVARVLPGILKANRIQVKDAAMKYVIVSNEILTGEDAYPLQNQTAYVPLFFEDSVIMFQDTFGNRYMDVEYTKEPVLDEKELEEKCFEMYPDHPMLKMKACLEIMEKKDLEKEDVTGIETALDTLPVKPAYQQKMLTRIISYYRAALLGDDEAMDAEGGAYLLKLDKRTLSRPERVDVCETLIVQNYMVQAYEMIKEFGEEQIRVKRLAALVSQLILDRMFEEDDLLLHLAGRVFSDGHGDSVILDYLCEHYNGSGESMFRILAEAVKTHVETYDLEERLLAQCLFSGCEKHMDTVFDLYASRKETSDVIVKAYFTVKCTEYFLRDTVPGDKVFAYLEGAIHGMELRKVPEIYLLALAKFYSTLAQITEEQKALLSRMMDILSARGMVFAWYKDLAKYVDMPGEVMDKEIIEYHGRPDGRPILKIRILPDEEEFHEEEMNMVYKGIYVRQKLLFDGEIMEYEIWENEDGRLVKKAEGEVTCSEPATGDKGNRFTALNAMNLYLGMKDDRKLKESMTEYVTDSQIAKKLFRLA